MYREVSCRGGCLGCRGGVGVPTRRILPCASQRPCICLTCPTHRGLVCMQYRFSIRVFVLSWSLNCTAYGLALSGLCHAQTNLCKVYRYSPTAHCLLPVQRITNGAVFVGCNVPVTGLYVNTARTRLGLIGAGFGMVYLKIKGSACQAYNYIGCTNVLVLKCSCIVPS